MINGDRDLLIETIGAVLILINGNRDLLIETIGAVLIAYLSSTVCDICPSVTGSLSKNLEP
jgi:hypothetical protein